jgi:hypothetical protein
MFANNGQGPKRVLFTLYVDRFRRKRNRKKPEVIGTTRHSVWITNHTTLTTIHTTRNTSLLNNIEKVHLFRSAQT